MRQGICLTLVFAVALLSALSGCGNPMKRPPQNVFPGSPDYAKRIATFKITPEEAYKIAHEEAETDNKLQFLSKKPTVVAKQWYVFSMPQGTGATLQGYHVHGNTGKVRFFSQNKTVTQTR